MAGALTLDHLHVKRAIMVWPTCLSHRPLAGAVAVAVAFAKERQHPQ